MAFQRVIQRAILKVQSAGSKEVGSVDALLAILAEKDTTALRFLKENGVQWPAVADLVSLAVSEAPGPPRKVAYPHSAATVDGVTDVQVVLYNDDVTPMEFVGRVLQVFFGMSKEDAAETMLEVHREGAVVCGLYSRDDGIGLVGQVLAYAREKGYPLRCEAIAPKNN